MKEILIEFSPDQRNLIHLLHRIQNKYGYIPPQTISELSRYLKISESEIYGVLTFYKAFSLEPRGKHLVTVCLGTACHVRGASSILDELRRRLRIEPGETSEDNMYTLETVNCVGACALGPIIIIDGEYHGQMKTQKVEKLLKNIKQKEK